MRRRYSQDPLEEGWKFLRGALLAILCPYKGFLFLILASGWVVVFSMLTYYNECIIRLEVAVGEISRHVVPSWSVVVLSHKSDGEWSSFLTVARASVHCSCSARYPISVSPCSAFSAVLYLKSSHCEFAYCLLLYHSDFQPF